jgi:uncharacterized protein YuzE
MKKINQSLDQLNKSLERRSRHLMIQTLQKFEDAFPDVDTTREGQIFKTDLRNMFNDVIRAQRDELGDYEVEYRPLRMTDNGTLAMTQTFMQTVQKVEFGTRSDKPYLKISSDLNHARTLDAIRMELDAGILYQENGGIALEIVGTEPCVNSVLPLMDRYRLHEQVRMKYLAWRGQVVSSYLGSKE